MITCANTDRTETFLPNNTLNIVELGVKIVEEFQKHYFQVILLKGQLHCRCQALDKSVVQFICYLPTGVPSPLSIGVCEIPVPFLDFRIIILITTITMIMIIIKFLFIEGYF